jgi:RNA polymerase sigma factor (TIGR02999 family)
MRFPRGKLASMKDVTEILAAIEAGDTYAADQLLPLVYDELRTLAAQKMALEKPGQTLDATALVHEAYLRLVGDQHFNDRSHFFAAAAEAMRRILIDAARRRQAQKRGDNARRVELADLPDPAATPDDDLLAVDAALAELEQHDPQTARLVKLRYFSGLTHQEAAETLGISRRVADRIWAVAKAWLYQRIGTE